METRVRNKQTKEGGEGYQALLDSVQGHRSHSSLPDTSFCYEICGFYGCENVGGGQQNYMMSHNRKQQYIVFSR
jgi:hypothetical protein